MGKPGRPPNRKPQPCARYGNGVIARCRRDVSTFPKAMANNARWVFSRCVIEPCRLSTYWLLTLLQRRRLTRTRMDFGWLAPQQMPLKHASLPCVGEIVRNGYSKAIYALALTEFRMHGS